MVKPDETNDLKIVPGQDYVTLVTCTPYGINSHRLLVRGHRVEYDPDLEKQESKKLIMMYGLKNILNRL